MPLDVLILGCKSLGMAKGPDGKCWELLKSTNKTHWFVLDPDDPTGETGIFQKLQCNEVEGYQRSVQLNGTCQLIHGFDGCGGPPMTVRMNLYGQGVCKCHCPLNKSLCAAEDPRQIPESQCYQVYQPSEEDEDDYFDYCGYEGYYCVEEGTLLVTELPSHKVCLEGQTSGKNSRCYDEDQPAAVQEATGTPKHLRDYANYIRKIVHEDFTNFKHSQ